MPQLQSLTERRPVQALPTAVVERIAAGEVVHRPASVVRELVENALDAGASTIRVEIRGGGLRTIRVIDNGWGIPSAELELALTQHATSKISTLEDLTRLDTFGFRGEALASIASLSELRLCSAADDVGVADVVTVRMGASPTREREARPQGTTVTVRDLFADLPARRATLRSPAVETAHIVATVRDYALRHASVRFTLLSDDHVLLATSGAGVRGAVVEIYGADLGYALVEVPAQRVGTTRVSGWVASRAFTQRTTRHIVICVNGRPVTNGTLAACVQAGYRPLLRKGRHPIALFTIDMDPHDVDANVHPAKRQVLLRDERAIGAALRDAARTALATRAAQSPPPLTSLTHTYQHVRQAAFPLRRVRRAMHEPRPLFVSHRAQSPHGSLPSAFSAMSSLTALGQLDNCLIVAQSDSGDLLLIDQHRAHERLLYDALCRQPSLLQSSAALPASHEVQRVNGGGQLLLEPLVVELSPRQAQILTSRLTEMASLGLVCEPFGGATFLVRALPPVPEGAVPVTAFASELTADAAEDADDWLEHLRASLACRAALRRGQPLSPEEQRALLAALSQADVPAVCPHGSPIVVRWGRDQLARTFEW